MTILKNITHGIFNITVLVPGIVDTFKNKKKKSPAFSKVMSLQNKTNRGWGGVGHQLFGKELAELIHEERKDKNIERKGSPKKHSKKKDRQETRSTHNVFRL